MKIKLVSLFSGIGAPEKALQRSRHDVDLIAFCENDKDVTKAYSLIHNVNTSLNLGDITQVWTEEIKTNVDLITYGFPCQDISNAGKQKGFRDEEGNKTRSGLFFDALRIIRETQPRVAIAENVKNLTSKRFGNVFEEVLKGLEDAGYNNYWKVINSKDHDIPQNRERVFIVSIRKDIDDKGFSFPVKKMLTKSLKELLETEVEEKYYLNQGNQYDRIFIDGLRGKEGIKVKEATKSGYKIADAFDSVNIAFPNSSTRRGRVGKQVAQTLLTSQEQVVVIPTEQGYKLRKYTPRERFRLMGFDDCDYEKVENEFTDSQLSKMTGNSIVVNIMQGITKQIERYLIHED